MPVAAGFDRQTYQSLEGDYPYPDFELLIWGVHYQGTTRTLDQHIAKLCKKIEDTPSDPKYIVPVHGAGYRLKLI
ncbi:MAG: hypothetical protein GH155_03835 [Spirochaeta sp.]|nr:hypothetical protein [Spirochaeta sp.]